MKRKLSFSPSPRKRELVQLTKPKSRLFDDVSFPRKPERFSIQCRKDDNVQYRDLYVPQGFQVMYMSILGKVFNLLKCTTKTAPNTWRFMNTVFAKGCSHTSYSNAYVVTRLLRNFQTQSPLAQPQPKL